MCTAPRPSPPRFPLPDMAAGAARSAAGAARTAAEGAAATAAELASAAAPAALRAGVHHQGAGAGRDVVDVATAEAAEAEVPATTEARAGVHPDAGGGGDAFGPTETAAEAGAAASANAAALGVLYGSLPPLPSSPPRNAEEDAEHSDSLADEEVYLSDSRPQPVPTDGAGDVAAAAEAEAAVIRPAGEPILAALRPQAALPSSRMAGTSSDGVAAQEALAAPARRRVGAPSSAGSAAVAPLTAPRSDGMVDDPLEAGSVPVAPPGAGESVAPSEASGAAAGTVAGSSVAGSAPVAPLAAPPAGGTVPASDAADAAEGSDMPALSVGEEIISLVARLILFPGPAVVSKTLAIPALAVAYFISHMGFLSGLPQDEASAIIHKAFVDMFIPSSVAGWRTLCRMFGVSDRALYLSGRRAPQTHLAGQPATVPSSLNENINPKKEAQWVSRRLCLRTSISLHPDDENSSGPGSLTPVELKRVRDLLSTPAGRGLALGARCVVLPGADSYSAHMAATRLRFDWGHAWVPLSPPWRVVQALTPALLKPPHSDLSTVHLFPVDETEPSPAPTTPTARTPSSGKVVRRKRAASAPPRPPRQRRSSARVPEAPEVVSTLVPALPTLNHLCVSGEVLPNSCWPQGAWAMQLNLSSAHDLSAAGNVQLGVTVDFESPRADENGQYSYRVVVSQLETVATAMSKELEPYVTAAPSLDPGCRSVDFLNAVRGLCAQQVVKATTEAADGLQPSSQDDVNAMDTRDDDLVASDALRLHVCCAPPPPLEPFCFRFSFASRLRLHTEVVHMHRAPGRLWMLVAAEKHAPRARHIA